MKSTKTFKVGSVCTGIGACETAWKKLGWETSWVSEIEPYPCAVLHHRHGATRPEFMPQPELITESTPLPESVAETNRERENAIKTIIRNISDSGTLPNLGDMTRIHESETFIRQPIDLLVGGTPCQSFSIAGLREGLADPRGNLALVFLGLVDRKRPRWVVWENVPGVLSSWSDAAVVNPPENVERDLADAWADASDFVAEIYPPGRDRDRCRGALERALAPGAFEEAVQSADFDTFTSGLSELGYGVAWAVLDAQHFGVPQRRRRVFVVGYFGDHLPAAAVLLDRHCLSGHIAPRRQTGERTSPTINARTKSGGGLGTDHDINGGLIERAVGVDEGIAHTLKAKANSSHDATHDTYVAKCLNAKGGSGRQDAESETFVTHTLRGEGFDASEDGTGRGVPLVAGTLGANHGNIRAEDAWKGNLVHESVTPIDMRQASRGEKMTNNRAEGSSGGAPGTGIGEPGDPSPTIAASHVPAIAFSAQDNGRDATEEISPTLRKGGAGGGVQPAVAQVYDMRGNGDGNIAPTLTKSAAGDRPSDFAPMIFETRVARNGRGAPDEVCPPLKAESGETGKGDAAPVVFQQNSRSEVREIVGGVTGALAAEPGAQQQNYLKMGATVRRLTVVECERLQSFPDNYTLIPWDAPPRDPQDRLETIEYLKSHGLLDEEADARADTPDGHRYKGLGNSMNGNVMLWIGERIALVDAEIAKEKS